MKKCPFCAEEIQDEAIICRHCKTSIDRRQRFRIVPYAVLCAIALGVTLMVAYVYLSPMYGINPASNTTAFLISNNDSVRTDSRYEGAASRTYYEVSLPAAFPDGRLIVRQEPTRLSEIAAWPGQGTCLISDKPPLQAAEQIWIHVNFCNETGGWVPSQYLKENRMCADACRMLSEANKSVACSEYDGDSNGGFTRWLHSNLAPVVSDVSSACDMFDEADEDGDIYRKTCSVTGSMFIPKDRFIKEFNNVCSIGCPPFWSAGVGDSGALISLSLHTECGCGQDYIFRNVDSRWVMAEQRVGCSD